MTKPEAQPVPSITIIIVTYHSRETVGAALNSLTKAYERGVATVVLVDNASTDGTADYVADMFPWVTLVRSNRNIGFGRGCNTGFEYVETPYVLLLNPDAVIELDALLVLVAFMEKEAKAGICGPAVRESSGKMQPSGGLPYPWTVIVRPLLPGWVTRKQRHIMPGDAPEKTDWICGSVMFLKTDMLKQVGKFDSRFFLYFEETDLCYRAQLAGWEVWTVGEAVAEHINAASAKISAEQMAFGTISEHYYRSRFYYLKKHYGLLMAILTEIGELFCMFIRAVLQFVRKRTYTRLRDRLRAPFFKMPIFPSS